MPTELIILPTSIKVLRLNVLVEWVANLLTLLLILVVTLMVQIDNLLAKARLSVSVIELRSAVMRWRQLVLLHKSRHIVTAVLH